MWGVLKSKCKFKKDTMAMSAQNVQSFLEAVEKSPELQRQIAPIQADERPENLRKFIDIAGKAGYSFTEADLMTSIRQRAERQMQSGEQLSEADLEKVAGGMWCIFTCLITSISK
jgi:predicted ribosomally synthesized peptide with nif11-like leader